MSVVADLEATWARRQRQVLTRWFNHVITGTGTGTGTGTDSGFDSSTKQDQEADGAGTAAAAACEQPELGSRQIP